MSEKKLILQWCSGCGAQMHEGEPNHKRTDPGHSDYVPPLAARDSAGAGLDELRAKIEAIDIGAYPAASPDGPRTPWQEGWNAADAAWIAAIEAALDAARLPVAEHLPTDDGETPVRMIPE